MSPGVLHVTVPGQPERLLGARPRIRVGRNPDCDVVIADQAVSWEHCVVELRGDGCWR
jgi:pSer/pThr/pTyr-binding forkhead associated (FHA) protein